MGQKHWARGQSPWPEQTPRSKRLKLIPWEASSTSEELSCLFLSTNERTSQERTQSLARGKELAEEREEAACAKMVITTQFML